jgi:type I restriction enzyme M protein
MTLLNKRGRAAVVVPDNVLFEGGAGETIRRYLLAEFDVHTLFRLPAGIFYAPSVKANVLFFDRKVRRRPSAQASGLWVYDLRSGSSFSLKSKPMGDGALQEFITCYKVDRRTTRTESERFRRFDVAKLLEGDRCSLDVGLSNRNDGIGDFPSPAALAAEIIDKLETAADAIRSVEEDLGR